MRHHLDEESNNAEEIRSRDFAPSTADGVISGRLRGRDNIRQAVLAQ